MQGHVYHWKHGWIPLTHYAALVKAHGSHKGAAKYLNESNGHHGSESHKLGEAARASSVRSEIAGMDHNQLRHYVAKAAAEGRATEVPAGARHNATAEIHVDGVRVGEASALGHHVTATPGQGGGNFTEKKLTPKPGYKAPRETPVVDHAANLRKAEEKLGRDQAERVAANMGYVRHSDGTYHKAFEETQSAQGWVSPRGVPFPASSIAKVDKRLLAKMYEAESNGGMIPRGNLETERAFNLGYLKPRRRAS